MSVVFLPIKGGGWVNAATIQIITKENTAIVPDHIANDDITVMLAPAWHVQANQLIMPHQPQLQGQF